MLWKLRKSDRTKPGGMPGLRSVLNETTCCPEAVLLFNVNDASQCELAWRLCLKL